MKLKKLLIASLLLSMLAGCALTRSDTNAWLETQAGKSPDNVAGKWATNDGVGSNWGEANFVQDGSRFYGRLGSYDVDGSVNGSHIYLALTAGKKAYYTARLSKQPDGSYVGKAVQGSIIDNSSNANSGFQLMSLRRIGN